jgi:hypothetical protein
MSWREVLKSEVSDAQPQTMRSPKKTESDLHCADCADIAGRQSKLNESKPREPKQNREERQSRLMECLANACKGLYITPMEVHESLSLDDIDAWENGDFTQKELSSFAGLLVDRRLMDQGKRPDHFTEKALCQQCGPVYLWSRETVLGCPWCFNRVAGRPIPRPGSVRCGECRYFERVRQPYSHPHLGHCAKGEPEAIVGLWDSDRRYCLYYLPLETETNTETKEQENGK